MAIVITHPQVPEKPSCAIGQLNALADRVWTFWRKVYFSHTNQNRIARCPVHNLATNTNYATVITSKRNIIKCLQDVHFQKWLRWMLKGRLTFCYNRSHTTHHDKSENWYNHHATGIYPTVLAALTLNILPAIGIICGLQFLTETCVIFTKTCHKLTTTYHSKSSW